MSVAASRSLPNISIRSSMRICKILRHAILWCLAIVVASCAKVERDYFYISLEQSPGIKVVDRRMLVLKDLQHDGVVPTDYVAERGAYILQLRILDVSYFPHMEISVSGADHGAYEIRPRVDISVVGEGGNICASYDVHTNGSVMDFGWDTDCLAERVPKFVSFDILNQTGVVIGHEHILFTVVQNGTYTVLDAI